ncbi:MULTISPECIES: hypothetical protein [unclassified Arsukibacterium]|uniref:hypothetical protein n=1 Tax=unclassified Arsukibacterium TaxID=2635278 RepID=UPI000C564B15|nr:MULTISPECIES: hypothetical protein [unclassified Arsukibacterium]MAA92913.1 hypothetical protein [Rheinheimera sp.]MBM34978.1 hypothetical protein [Rheinheimera sp.]HAW93270.1 hypothetical protein [Candidatus Azambacteria bacterium]|tara:strand:- start:530 stop:880 length:351 start_codon:yes stop_codon:yes gene_type:complete
MKQPTYDESQDVKWDDGTYGTSEEHVRKAELPDEMMAQFDKAASMTLISIRLQDELITDLKEVAALHGIGYQPMVRQLLKRFVVAEKKVLAARNEAMQIKVDPQQQCDEKLKTAVA